MLEEGLWAGPRHGSLGEPSAGPATRKEPWMLRWSPVAGVPALECAFPDQRRHVTNQSLRKSSREGGRHGQTPERDQNKLMGGLIPQTTSRHSRLPRLQNMRPHAWPRAHRDWTPLHPACDFQGPWPQRSTFMPCDEVCYPPPAPFKIQLTVLLP